MGTKTTKPTGLTITRDGLSFICSWKIASKNHDGGQVFEWRTNIGEKAKKWDKVTVTKTATSKKVTLNASNYYPAKSNKEVTKFVFVIKGKRSGYDYSDWSSQTFNIYAPNTPTLNAEWDSSRVNVTNFSWTTEIAGDDHRPFSRVEWQSILVKDCSTTNGKKLTWKSTTSGWRSGTGIANSSVEIQEETTTLATGSYTRWVRVRSVGIGGASAWVYKSHVYATPNTGVMTGARVESESGTVTTISTDWIVDDSKSRPIDSAEVQYTITTPIANLQPPSNASWTTATTVADSKGGTDTARFVIDNTVGLDQCLWTRVVTTHDSNKGISSPQLVKSGRLTTPTNLNPVIDYDTYRATVSATNASSVPDSVLAVIFRKTGQADYVCGIITGSDPITVQCAPWEAGAQIAFGVYSFQGTYSSSQRADGTSQYAVTANMKSDEIWEGGSVPSAPAGVNTEITSLGEVMLTWTWTWQEANRTEVSWSKNQYAWESTDGPQTHLIESVHAAKIRVSSLETGTTWYFRIRLAKQTGDDIVYGPYCEPVAVNLSTAPLKPILMLSSGVISETQSLNASWSYTTTDGTDQNYAELWTANVNGDSVTPIAQVLNTTTAKSAVITAGTWSIGTTQNLIVRVVSTSGIESDWSDPIPVTVANPATCDISASSLESVTVEDDDQTTRTVTALRSMPLSVTVTGAGDGGTTTVVVERAEAYQMNRPDDAVFNGFEGEIVATVTQMGESEITITQDMLLGMLDDGARYRIVATTQDDLGQSATKSQEFVVMWTHQAIMPEATVEIDEENLVAFITPSALSGTVEGDVCDIYRLSADKPELIISGGTFGTKYVDPYPAFGPFGGHRVVFRSINGDYITEDYRPAWIDLGESDGDTLNPHYAIIDFDDGRVQFQYNLDLSNNWSKDFAETKYLGGSVQGDWNPAVSRTGTLNGVVVALTDEETVRSFRQLAVHSGICHVRTPEGSSFSADVQVSEDRDLGHGAGLVNFSLSFTRVDTEGMEGVTYEEWIAEEEQG